MRIGADAIGTPFALRKGDFDETTLKTWPNNPGEGRRNEMKVKSKVKAGGMTLNRCETLREGTRE